MKLSRIIKAILSKTGMMTLYKIMKYSNYTKFLNLHKCYVIGIHQIDMINNQLVSTGDDPQILIKFFRGYAKAKFNVQIDHNNDCIEVYYLDAKTNNFSQNDFNVIGNCDGIECNKTIYFNKNGVIRLDLVKTPGVINIQKLEIVPIVSKFSDKNNQYNYVLDNLDKESKNEKCVVVTHSMNETGAPILAYNISKKMKENGYDVLVVSLSDGYLENKYRKLNIPVINLHQSPISKVLHNPEIFDMIVEKLHNCGYKNVLTNTIISGITVPVFKKYDFNIISLIHEMKNSIKCYDMEQGGRNISFYSDKIIFPNKLVEDEFYQVFDRINNNSFICPQGLYKVKKEITKNYKKIYDTYNIPAGSKIILGSGTADFRKGIDLFLNAALNLIEMEQDEEYHFIWTGKILDENLENWYKCQFSRMNASGRFHNVDFIKNIEEYQNLVECCDAFWLTSREDPYPSVMIEALEYNTPVLAFSKCGGADVLLADGRGVLVDNFDIDKLALETHKLLKDQKLIDEMLIKAQDYIKENLNFDKYIDTLCNIFKEIADKENIKYESADVSVIVPNYNYENYLPIRLMSIINQTIKPKEIILLDDVSTDNSIEVSKPILEYGKNKYNINYKIIENIENNGCFRQWLKGINEATCEYIWIAEADDYAENNFLYTTYSAFKDEEVVLSYCKSRVINEYSDVVDYDYNSYIEDLGADRFKQNFVEEGKIIISDYLTSKNIIPNASSVVFRKSASVGMEDYLKNYSAIGDWFAYIYLASKGKIAYSCLSLNGHRRHSKSIIANKEKSKLFIKEVLMIKKYLLTEFDYDDSKINKLLTSITNFEFDYNMINSDNELSDLFNGVVELANSKRTKENLLIVLPDLEVGGGQTVGIRLANNFTKYYNVFVVNTREQLVTEFMKNMIGNDVGLLPYHDNMDLLRLYASSLDFKAVISLIWWSDKLSYVAFKDMGIKRIISMHGCYENILHNPQIDLYFEKNVDQLLSTANYIVYTAEKNKEILEKTNLINDKKVCKIDNGFVLDKFPKKERSSIGIKDDDFVFGLVARAIPEKGYEQAIEAINIINSKSSKKAHLILVGSGNYIKELKENNNSDYIHFIDEFTEPLEWMGWEDIFDVGLLPTYFKSESLPTVIVEYLFLNKPVIATDVAEIKSMIISDNNSCGITINLKDGKPNVDELVDAMQKIMNDKELYNQLKNNTNLFADRFNMDKCIDNYRKLIEDSLEDESDE